MSNNPRYIVLTTRKRYFFFLSRTEAGPFTYQKALQVALVARSTNPKTFVSAAIHIAVKKVNGPGEVPGSLIMALQGKG